RINGAIRHFDMNRQMRVLAICPGKPTLVGENIRLARLKGNVDRVLADDGRDRPGRRLNQISYGELRDADFSINRSTNLCVRKIYLACSSRACACKMSALALCSAAAGCATVHCG